MYCSRREDAALLGGCRPADRGIFGWCSVAVYIWIRLLTVISKICLTWYVLYCFLAAFKSSSVILRSEWLPWWRDSAEHLGLVKRRNATSVAEVRTFSMTGVKPIEKPWYTFTTTKCSSFIEINCRKVFVNRYFCKCKIFDKGPRFVQKIAAVERYQTTGNFYILHFKEHVINIFKRIENSLFGSTILASLTLFNNAAKFLPEAAFLLMTTQISSPDSSSPLPCARNGKTSRRALGATILK